jgi:hypothetical protein
MLPAGSAPSNLAPATLARTSPGSAYSSVWNDRLLNADRLRLVGFGFVYKRRGNMHRRIYRRSDEVERIWFACKPAAKETGCQCKGERSGHEQVTSTIGGGAAIAESATGPQSCSPDLQPLATFGAKPCHRLWDSRMLSCVVKSSLARA